MKKLYWLLGLLLTASLSWSALPKLDSYGGCLEIQGKKTGFFHTQKINGRWLLVDPEGHGFFAAGMDSLGHYPDSQAKGRGWQSPSPALDAFNKLLKEKYPQKSDWAKAELKRLQDLGFNSLLGSPQSFEVTPYPYTQFASVSGWEGEQLKDVFSRDFQDRVDKAAKVRCRPLRDDKNLIGYFSDNELPWAKVWGGGFLDEYLSLSPTAAGSGTALSFLGKRYVNVDAFNKIWDTQYKNFDAISAQGNFKPGPKLDRIKVAEDRDAFLELVARRYYSTVYKAFKAADPNHLVLGTRFLTGEVSLAVARGMKGNVDVVSMNCYALRSFPIKFFAKFCKVAAAPMILTEFGYSAFDAGIEQDHSGAIPRVVETQQDRADKYAWYLESALSQPEIVGAYWWWVLDGFAGRNRGNFGFISWKDELYPVLAERASQVNHGIYKTLLSKPAKSASLAPQEYPIAQTAPLKMDGDSKKYHWNIHLDQSLKYEGYEFEKAGLSGDAVYLQDADNLYVAIQVNDKDVKTYSKAYIEKNKFNIWETDGVELRLDWIQALLSFDGKKPFISMVPADPRPGIEVNGGLNKAGYFFELKVPKSCLIDAIHDGHLRLALGINDGMEGIRYRQLQWPQSFEWIYPETYADGLLGQGPAMDIKKLLSKGINMDHVFDPYQGMGDPSLKFDEAQFKEMDFKLKESEFQQVAGLGFTHVRLNLGRAFIQEGQAPYKLRPAGLTLLDKAVDMALKNHLGIILDMHQVPAPKLFSDPKALEAFKKLWKGLAAHYAHVSPNIVYEFLNEPAVPALSDKEPKEADLERWRGIVRDLVNTVRSEDQEHYIIVMGGGWSGAQDLIQMGNLHLPRLIYTFHCYEPMLFTHQGASWVGKTMEGVRGVDYPVTESAVQRLRAEAKPKEEDAWPFTAYPKGFDKDSMRAYLQPVLDFGKKEQLILYCGEFGVHKPFAPPASRARWISDYTDILNSEGVAWAMWAYHSGFDLVDEKGKTDPVIVKALGLKY
jgi:endoglucanase